MDLKIKDVAELLNVSETTIRRWLGEGKIPAYRINHQYRFSRTEIESWVMSQKLGQSFCAAEIREEEAALAPAKKSGSKQFSLYRALHKGGIVSDVPGTTKEDVIRWTMKSVAKELNVDADVMSDLLLDRERLQSTGLGNGIAIPHTRDHLLNHHFDVVVVAFPKQPLNYGSLDGKPVHTLFFLFACDDKRHLNLLAKIAHLSSLPQTTALLATKPTKEEFLDYVKSWESNIQKAQEEELSLV